MLIDWFTVCAQALNFLILVWLLTKFLYRPILAAIDARERRIAADLADAAARKAEAVSERDDFARRSAELAGSRTALLDQARTEADALRRQLSDEARSAAEVQDAQRRQALLNDGARLRETITGRTGQEVIAIVRRTLGDLASSTLEERLVEVLLVRLRALDGPARQDLVHALGSSGKLLVRSAFALTPAQQAALRQALADILSAPVETAFETRAELICGIELIAGGRKVSWSVADHLASMEQMVAGLVEARADAGQQSQAHPSQSAVH
jgi:F-type H+-transporting ATPase subunit b